MTGHADPVAQAEIDRLIAENTVLNEALDHHRPVVRRCRPTDYGHEHKHAPCLVVAIEDQVHSFLIRDGSTVWLDLDSITCQINTARLSKMIDDYLA